MHFFLRLAPLILIASSGAAEPSLHRFAYAEAHMSTTFRIVLYAPDEAAANLASAAAFERIAQLNAIMSDYDDDSELCKLNDQSGGPAVVVSAELFDVLAKSVESARQTSGAFDVTVGPVVKLWKRARRRKELPDADDLAIAEKLVGASELILDTQKRTVHLRKKGMMLDLGGVAKGYAVDQALMVLKASGIASALVAGGGDIGVSNPPPGQLGWRIEIQPLDKSKPATGAKLLLKNSAVSTSGDVEQHLDIGAKRYSHIVDPKTGKALEGRNSITVTAKDCTTSDALATAVCVLGVEKGFAALDKIEGVAAFFVLDQAGAIESFESKRWPEVPRSTQASSSK